MGNASFFLYYFASFVGFAAIGLILLINKIIHGKYDLKNHFMLFVVATLLIGILYFMEAFFLNDFLERDGRTALERVIDVELYCMQGFFFFRYQREEMRVCSEWLSKVTDSLILIFMGISVISYGFFMDGMYYVPEGGLRVMTLIVQSLFILMMAGFGILYSTLCFRQIDSKLTKSFCIGSNCLIVLNGLWNGIFTILLIVNDRMFFGWDFGAYDFTSALLLTLNVITVIFIYKKDFITIDARKQSSHDHSMREDRIERIFSDGRLTAREREIALLLLEAQSYESIAQQLCISKHTVKRHVHNIYEKLEISTKIDLIKLVED